MVERGKSSFGLALFRLGLTEPTFKLREKPLSYQLEGIKKAPLVPGNQVRFGEREAAKYRRRGDWLSKDSI
jgi:hypothetical protein